MTDRPAISTLEQLRRKLAEKSHELSQLDVMLADYHAEHARLICDLRRLQAQLRDAEEELQANPTRLSDHQLTGGHDAS